MLAIFLSPKLVHLAAIDGRWGPAFSSRFRKAECVFMSSVYSACFLFQDRVFPRALG